jgi:hypothetical protein
MANGPLSDVNALWKGTSIDLPQKGAKGSKMKLFHRKPTLIAMVRAGGGCSSCSGGL